MKTYYTIPALKAIGKLHAIRESINLEFNPQYNGIMSSQEWTIYTNALKRVDNLIDKIKQRNNIFV